MVQHYELSSLDSSLELQDLDPLNSQKDSFDSQFETQKPLDLDNGGEAFGTHHFEYVGMHMLGDGESYKGFGNQIQDNEKGPGNKLETPYNRFLERLKHHSCIDIVRSVKGLIAMLPGGRSRSDVAPIVHNFIDVYTPKLLELPIFANLPDEERLFSAEGFEKFTLQKLYSQCYRMDPVDQIEDELLWIKITSLDWVEPCHLEMADFANDETLLEAEEHLRRLSRYKAPRDKLIGILNACRLVVHALEKTSNHPASADDTFPLLIYTVLRANPAELHSTIEFVHYFRHPSKHVAEEAYAFTLLVSAVEYIKAIGKGTSLKMDPAEFEIKYQQALFPHQQRREELEQSLRLYKSPRHQLASVVLHQTLVEGLKRLAPPGHFWKHLFTSKRSEAAQALEALEACIRDVQLIFDPATTTSPDPVALLSDWRVLNAMRKDAMQQIADIKSKI
ncbi:bifunctional VPS9 domain/VPS9 domain superfamily/Vacuolar protein sorting-associated protein 9-like [Babesia duncani]|uniref:Bifunctional VPS9 domain/VPS9 domain superfamily/Vacuolar protein sorting-associated protein 9-like n=1 Tax=Babesia duncani TaxID=323732 RepID=A0AAD9PIJ8_9APIC|nr:bifunctional VPS9 domain/VPS9 domain superfamily/Vacuolar protein sorting-associated protein 9-like [Babesia duncani]